MLSQVFAKPSIFNKKPVEIESTFAQQEWENEILNDEVTKKALSLSRMQEHLPKMIDNLKPVTGKKVDAFYLGHLKQVALDSLQSDSISAKCFIDLYEHAVKPRLIDGERLHQAQDAAIWLQRLDGFIIKDIESDFLEEIMKLFDDLLGESIGLQQDHNHHGGLGESGKSRRAVSECG
jgi:uncharacterized coiled-coil protein SlyX